MELSHFGLIGLVGALVFLTGTHLLWRSRYTAIAWLREFVWILRGELARKNGSRNVAGRDPVTIGPSRAPRSGALVLVGAVALMLLGQLLFFLDLTR